MAVTIPEQSDESTVMDMMDVEIGEPSNLFGEESEGEISDEAEEEPDDVEEPEEDETDEESDESVEEEAEETEEEPSNAVADNLKKALHAEREKRKAASQELTDLRMKMELQTSQDGSYKDAYEAVLASIKEYGLEDVMDVPKVSELSPEILEARKITQEKEQQDNIAKFYSSIREDAVSISPDYEEVNLSDNEHGTALTNLITAAVINGMPQEEAVKQGFETLRNVIVSAKKEALKNRQPAVKPKNKPKARTKQAAQSTRKDMVKNKDFDSLFSSMGKQMAKGD